TVLTSLTVTYGITGATPSVYNWTGNLDFMETVTVKLDTFAWMQGASTFTISISNPNGGVDEYEYNNTRIMPFTYVPVMPTQFVIECKTNNYAFENSYLLKDDEGNVILSRSGLTANTTYRDTLDLAEGCYEFKLTDSGEDGLAWWANTAQGSGYIRFKSAFNTSILKSFNSDFGGEVYMQFTVGLTNDVDDFIFVEQPELKIYPNPSGNIVYIDFDLPSRESGIIEIYDVFGKKIISFIFSDKIADSYTVDVSAYKSGVYFVTLQTQHYIVSKRMMCGFE
ncbi:MAG: T9SS type A sorting domain-containing protein, partial [Bacteroidota bacterium]